ncbi:cbb3-type cytochrome oxidase subunit 3 [Falsihalocynthiibacter sp. BN13B15]|uniref:cbb3-type cytochrome oxidase subunit 3 n=1 Tax=Falsihalocynthiibacter sp. BN13B15 TaxID=3240871 RepID=UPI003510ABEA
MTYETLVAVAKIFGPIWMMGFFLIVVIRAYSPKRRAEHDRAARSILPDQLAEENQ